MWPNLMSESSSAMPSITSARLRMVRPRQLRHGLAARAPSMTAALISCPELQAAGLAALGRRPAVKISNVFFARSVPSGFSIVDWLGRRPQIQRFNQGL
jgi:hypothetical protein